MARRPANEIPDGQALVDLIKQAGSFAAAARQLGVADRTLRRRTAAYRGRHLPLHFGRLSDPRLRDRVWLRQVAERPDVYVRTYTSSYLSDEDRNANHPQSLVSVVQRELQVSRRAARAAETFYLSGSASTRYRG